MGTYRLWQSARSAGNTTQGGRRASSRGDEGVISVNGGRGGGSGTSSSGESASDRDSSTGTGSSDSSSSASDGHNDVASNAVGFIRVELVKDNEFYLDKQVRAPPPPPSTSGCTHAHCPTHTVTARALVG